MFNDNQFKSEEEYQEYKKQAQARFKAALNAKHKEMWGYDLDNVPKPEVSGSLQKQQKIEKLQQNVESGHDFTVGNDHVGMSAWGLEAGKKIGWKVKSSKDRVERLGNLMVDSTEFKGGKGERADYKAYFATKALIDEMFLTGRSTNKIKNHIYRNFDNLGINDKPVASAQNAMGVSKFSINMRMFDPYIDYMNNVRDLHELAPDESMSVKDTIAEDNESIASKIAEGAGWSSKAKADLKDNILASMNQSYAKRDKRLGIQNPQQNVKQQQQELSL